MARPVVHLDAAGFLEAARQIARCEPRSVDVVLANPDADERVKAALRGLIARFGRAGGKWGAA
jgi:hypothetical protein